MKNEPANFQLLLADDDALIRSGLEKIIQTHFPASELTVISCENGLVARQILEHEPIDLLITDIKMPLCSGIELLQTIQDRKIPCYSIVLSGYDDFNLVRSALRCGAKDYLLKPVDEDLLIHIIEDVKRSVSRTQTVSSEALSASVVLKMQKLLEDCFSMASNPPASDGLSVSSSVSPELHSFLQDHGLSLKSPCLLCCIDIARSLYSNQFTLFQFLADRLNTSLTALPQDLSGKLTAVYGGIGSFWIVLFLGRTEKLTPLSVLQPFLDLLKQEHLKYSYTTCWYPLADLHAAHEFCKKGFETYYYDLPIKKGLSPDPEELTLSLEKAADAAAAYDYTNTLKALEHCFSLFTLLKPPISDFKKQMNHFLYSILTRNPAFIPVVSTEKFTDYDVFEHIATAESLSVLQKKLYFSINHMIESILLSMKDKDDYVIQKAKEYIHNNFADNISLNDVAAHVFLNGNYFSTFFKQKTGTTFRDYLRSCRIERAKELLRSTHLKIYEVGLQVGYNEQSHFVRAFKSVTGITPGEFREGI